MNYGLQLLGPLSLRRAGRVVALPTQKVQALLLLLALGGQAHRARLAAWLWPETPDSGARRNLRRELARLRDAGVADLLRSEGELLSLTEDVVCDAQAFWQALQEQRHDEALALWRGPPADGLHLEGVDSWADWLAAERAKLVQGRRQALQGAAQAAEARGDTATALAHVQALLHEDPLQEQHHREAMRLLAASGQRAAALAQYSRCRALLQHELGLQPAAETEALLASLRGNAAEATSPTNPTSQSTEANPAAGSDARARGAARPAEPAEASSWPRELPLVGRDTAWAKLQQAWRAGETLVIEGEAGVGKTRLACEFAASCGAYALAQCRRSDAGVPYASFTRALRQLAGDTLAQAELPTWVRLELAHVLPELAQSQPGLGAAVQRIGSAEEQRRFYEACAAAWRALSDGSFDTVVIDDWHLADDASRALLGFIVEQQSASVSAPEPGQSRTLIVLRPELDDGARRRLRAMTESSSTLHIALRPLNAEQVYELVQRLSGAPAPRRFAQRLERATGGNPFFVAETLRQWLGMQLLSVGPDGVWKTPFDGATPDYGELPVPDSVRDTVIARVQLQPDIVRRLLEAAALATEPFTPALLAGACALSEVEALDAIEQAVAADFLREREGGYAFLHDLVQHALEDALAPERRRLVHRRLALGAQASGMSAADIALHWEAGGEPQRAVAYRIAAAEAALALYADSDAEAHWRAALAHKPTPAQRVRIQGQRWSLLRNRDDHPGLMAAVADLRAAREQALANATPDTPEAAAVALDAALHAAEILSFIHREAEALQQLQACLADPALGPTRRAQALRIQSQALSRLGRTEEAQQVTEQALAAGGLTPLQQGELLHALSYTCFLRGQPAQSLSYARRALAVWEAAGARRLVARAHASIGRSLDMLDEQGSAWAELEHAYALASELRLVGLQREVANNLANNRLNLGEPARAIAVVNEAWALSPHFSMPAMPVYFIGILLRARFQLGQLGPALDLAEDGRQRALALGDAMTLADHACMALDVHVLIGDIEGAQRVADGLRGHTLAGLGYIRVKVSFGLVLLALAVGDLDAARAHLAAIGDVQALEQPPDRAYAHLRQAQVALAAGQAEAALNALDLLRGTRVYPEVLATACSTRLQALALLGRVPGARDLAETDAALASGTLPAMDTLTLRHVRRQAALRLGDMAGAARLQAQMAEQVQVLAASLDTTSSVRPVLRKALLARWAAELGAVHTATHAD